MSSPQVGSATVVINPPRGASIPGYFHGRQVTGIHDDVQARATVIEGEPPLALLALDVIGVSRETVLAIRSAADADLDLPGERIFVSATHTHTGPPMHSTFLTERDQQYLEQLVVWCVEALRLAQGNLRPAALGVASIQVPGLAFNRRYWMADGSVKTNPGIGNPEVVRPAGPVNDKLTVTAFRPLEDGPLTLLVNFALHADTVGGTEISADYVGYLTGALQEALGQDTVILFLNGPCGDINHWDVLGGKAEKPVDNEVSFMHGDQDPQYPQRVGHRLGEGVIDLLPDLEYEADWLVHEAHSLLTVGVRQPSAEQLERAEGLLVVKAPQDLQTIEEVYDYEARQLSRLEVTEVELEIQALRLGANALVGLPNEVFTELGQLIQATSPFAETMVVELANGCEGYLPTARAFAEGGYETMLARSSKLVPEAGEMIAAQASELLQQLAAG